MLNNIKTLFSIKDLENLTGIKAHTIRIWENRYNLLQPERTSTNIRQYNTENLQKLLNISLLNKNGYKISKIACLPGNEILARTKTLINSEAQKSAAINEFKVSMLAFDHKRFHNTFNNLIQENSFENTFTNVILPLLEEIGLLWQTNTITPANEHFITELIRQKIYFNIDRVHWIQQVKPEQYILFLPYGEIHDLGLLFIHYKLLLEGYNSIYLGQSIPLDNLKEFKSRNSNFSLISYLTIAPSIDEIQQFCAEIKNSILNNTGQLHLFGKQIRNLNATRISKNIHTYKNLSEFFVKLK